MRLVAAPDGGAGGSGGAEPRPGGASGGAAAPRAGAGAASREAGGGAGGVGGAGGAGGARAAGGRRRGSGAERRRGGGDAGARRARVGSSCRRRPGRRAAGSRDRGPPRIRARRARGRRRPAEQLARGEGIGPLARPEGVVLDARAARPPERRAGASGLGARELRRQGCPSCAVRGVEFESLKPGARLIPVLPQILHRGDQRAASLSSSACRTWSLPARLARSSAWSAASISSSIRRSASVAVATPMLTVTYIVSPSARRYLGVVDVPRRRSARIIAPSGVGLQQHERQLVPAVAGPDVDRARRLEDHLGDRPQDLVALEVAHRVVDRLEVVDVDDQHRDVVAEAPRAGISRSSICEHAAAVPQAGERVRHRLLARPACAGPVECARARRRRSCPSRRKPEQQGDGGTSDREEAALLARARAGAGLLVVGCRAPADAARNSPSPLSMSTVSPGSRWPAGGFTVATSASRHERARLALGQPLHLGRVVVGGRRRDPQLAVAAPSRIRTRSANAIASVGRAAASTVAVGPRAPRPPRPPGPGPRRGREPLQGGGSGPPAGERRRELRVAASAGRPPCLARRSPS